MPCLLYVVVKMGLLCRVELYRIDEIFQSYLRSNCVLILFKRKSENFSNTSYLGISKIQQKKTQLNENQQRMFKTVANTEKSTYLHSKHFRTSYLIGPFMPHSMKEFNDDASRPAKTPTLFSCKLVFHDSY